MAKSRKPASHDIPPELLQDETTIYFGADIPAYLRRREPRVGDDAPGWLQELVEWWRPVADCPYLFYGETRPVSELGDEIAERVAWGEQRRLVSLDWQGGGPGLASSWSFAAVDFGPSSRLYVEWREMYGCCLLAYSDDPDQGRGDRNALRALFRENGFDFDRVFMYGAPNNASGSEWVSDTLLVELLAAGFGQGEWADDMPDDPEALARSIVLGKSRGKRRRAPGPASDGGRRTKR